MFQRHFGPRLDKDGATFRLWAPSAGAVEVVLDKPYPLRRGPNGWYSGHVAHVAPGTRYRFRIDGEISVPDPASDYQPDDVSGPSEIIDQAAYQWQAQDWRGRPWQDAVILEAHVGTFTAAGTWRAMVEKLDHLVDTGVTVLELMPLADFAGNRNWGYDGVLWFAPDSAYGRPDDLKTLVDEAHRRGLMVFLDVVYNHFGPEGNYLNLYAPEFFSRAHTPWGNAIDYRVPAVAAFAVENALHWLCTYRFDGLRLDAVHAIAAPGKFSLLRDLSMAVGKLAEQTGRHIHLVLENDDNQATLLEPDVECPSGKYRAQWNDDYHHAWHVLLTGESHGYYRDYQDRRLNGIARALGSGFVYQGEPSCHREGRPRGEPTSALPPLAFVNFLQNHDQIGNRPFGDRLVTVADPQAVEAALAITLLAPTVPMLFMGEEWGATNPFPFFCDFQGDLAEAVREGRKKEFAEAYAAQSAAIPDALAQSTRDAAVLDWGAACSEPGRKRLALVSRLIAVRRREIVPRLAGARFGDVQAFETGLLSANWHMGDGARLVLTANLSDNPASPGQQEVSRKGTLIWGDELMANMPPWAVLCRLEPSDATTDAFGDLPAAAFR